MPTAMAATTQKIKVTPTQSAGAAYSYLADPQAMGDYYTGSSRSFMRWLASPHARTFFGLAEDPDRWCVESLLSGIHPMTRKVIRQLPGPGRPAPGHHGAEPGRGFPSRVGQ